MRSRLTPNATKQTPHKYELGLITFDEVDKLCQDRLEEEMLQLLPGGENEDVKQLILQKLPAHLVDFADVCSKKESDVLPPHRDCDHRITVKADAKPMPPRPLYQMNRDQLQMLKEYLIDNLGKGFIVASKSPRASPVLFARKPGGGWRFCVDYRQLNLRSEVDQYPLPLIDEVLAKLQGATIFTKVDVRQAFHRIRMHPDSEIKTAFKTRYGRSSTKCCPSAFATGQPPSSGI